jgi:ElaB/YqjD/DUF883 family membrane-anchored ribosome-binding protein
MSSTSERLGKQAKEAAEGVEEMGGTVKDAAQEKFEQVGERATECCERAREEAHGVACHCEQFLRHKPLTCVLLAAGVGWLLGRFGKRG